MKKENLEIIGTAAPQTFREGLPLYLSPVKAGFPSPADDFIDRKLDLHEYLVHNEAATFFLRAQGDSMTGAGIHDGDLLIVDRSIEAAHDKIVIAALDGELTVKRLQRTKGKVFLAPENPDYPVFDITEGDTLDKAVQGQVPGGQGQGNDHAGEHEQEVGVQAHSGRNYRGAVTHS